MSDRLQTDWSRHYDTPEGPRKVAARRAVYDCLEEGVEAVNFEIEVITALGMAGLRDTATIVDVGCSYPSFLELWQITGHKGRLIGIEPNTEQFNGLPFWQPLGADSGELKEEDRFKAFFKRHGGAENLGMPNVELFEAHANYIPLPNESADLVSFMFSFYHVPKEKQPTAIDEAKRVLVSQSGDEVTGVFALATSGNHNKEGIRENETKIAAVLSELMGMEIQPPEPLNSGFTSEDAEELLTKKFQYVAEFEHKARIVFDTPFHKAVLLNAYHSLHDKYRHKSGITPDKRTFELATQNVVGEQLLAASIHGASVEDKLHQSLFIAGHSPLRLPSKYHRLS